MEESYGLEMIVGRTMENHLIREASMKRELQVATIVIALLAGALLIPTVSPGLALCTDLVAT